MLVLLAVVLACLCVFVCLDKLVCCFFFFFFQAEDGIRDLTVTGVQTCALPISVVLGCAGGPAVGRSAPPVPPPSPVPPSVDSLLASLTVRQKVAQLVMPRLSGSYTAFDDSLFQLAARWVDSLEIGGVIVFSGSPFDIATKLNALQRRSRVPLLVREYVRGLHEYGMLATIKHFPGHGDTQTDSHIGLPVIAAGYPRLDSLELVPFRAGIAAGADVVMSAHIAFPALTGSNDPGTMSAAVLTGLLRDSLHFGGLVVTDALDMGAIVTAYGAGEAAVRAFLAGSDLLLIPADPDSAVNAMAAAVESGRIARARLDQSVRRLLDIKQRLGLFGRRTVPLDSIMLVVGGKRWQDAANDLAVRALTLVRDAGGRLHALRARRSRIALIAYADELSGGAGQYLTDLLHRGGDTVEYFRLWPMSGPLSYDSARAVIARSPATVFVANVRPLSGRGRASAALAAGGHATAPAPVPASAGIPAAAPATLGFDSTRLAAVVAYLREEVDSGAFPGAVVAVGRHGRLALVAPVGHYGVDDPPAVEAGNE